MKSKDKPSTPSSLCKESETELQGKTHSVEKSSSHDMQRLIHELEIHQTELKMQNEELRNSRQEVEELLAKYTELYDFAPIGYFTLDKDGVIVKANFVGARTFNVQRGQLIGRRFDLLISPQSRQEFDSFRNAVLQGDKEQTCEVTISTDNKRSIYAQVKGAALQSSDQMHLAIMDITERKRAEEAIRLNEARLDSLFNISQYKANDVRDLLKFVLEEAIRLTGSKLGYIYHYNEQRREFTLNNWSSNVMKECTIAEPQAIYQLDKTGIWGEAVRQGRPIIVNNFHAPDPLKKSYPDGHALLSKYMTIPVIIDDAIVGVIGLANKSDDYDEADVRQLTLLMDSAWKIVDRKQMEKALRTISDRYRSFIELTGELGWTTNADGEVVEDMPSWRIYTSQTYEEIKGWGWSKALHPDDLEHTLQIWKTSVMGKSAYETEYRIRRYDSIYRHFMVRGIPVLNKDGNIREWVGTCIDITERKAAEEAIKTVNQKLQAAYKEMESFSYSISHDLRAPLRHMSGFAELLIQRQEGQLDEKSHHYASLIVSASKKMGMLIDDLLAFSKMGRMEMKQRKVNLNDIVREAIQDIHDETKGRDIAWRIDELPDVYGDQSLLKLVFDNLISNAVKYTRTRPQAEIRIGCKDEGSEIICSVKDNGVGFDMKYVDRLFEVFQRLHAEEEFEGTGIGLANVQRIISRHGGRTWADGAVGQGATFYLTLPKTMEI